MAFISTRETLMALIDDIELISKELFENSIATKSQRLSAEDQTQLIELLVMKDKELKETIKLSSEQARIAGIMETVQEEVDRHDTLILGLEKQLHDAHYTLSLALFQARQKLASIERAKKRPVNSEELIKYAHRISSTYAITAPTNWQQGDLRRPYPTDREMRQGCLGQNGQLHQGHLGDQLMRGHHQGAGNAGGMGGGGFSWQHHTGDLQMHVGGHTAVVEKKEQDEVEVMSTDSSSSSSSDSQ